MTCDPCLRNPSEDFNVCLPTPTPPPILIEPAPSSHSIEETLRFEAAPTPCKSYTVDAIRHDLAIDMFEALDGAEDGNYRTENIVGHSTGYMCELQPGSTV
ncbi:hypothetical protein HGRIS_001596 [Hohenbuehelia grisea]|uniref:Uncharacterized protein n=1 Tax=Hohenbuehelia grisea TaxID=104357 RepID=A0ABR3JI37_9AGAR